MVECEFEDRVKGFHCGSKTVLFVKYDTKPRETLGEMILFFGCASPTRSCLIWKIRIFGCRIE